MTCCARLSPSCRFPVESCNCSTCSSGIKDICETCPKSPPYQPPPHFHKGCSCVHPIVVCACISCMSGEKEEQCHGHHSTSAQPIEKY